MHAKLLYKSMTHTDDHPNEMREFMRPKVDELSIRPEKPIQKTGSTKFVDCV